MYRVILDLDTEQIDQLTNALEEARDRRAKMVTKAVLSGVDNSGAAAERDGYDELLDTVNEAASAADEI